MQTTADEHVKRTKSHVQEAIEELTEIVINQCSGYDEFKIEYWATLKETLSKLIEIRDELKG